VGLALVGGCRDSRRDSRDKGDHLPQHLGRRLQGSASASRTAVQFFQRKGIASLAAEAEESWMVEASDRATGTRSLGAEM
jgi:hypothetical protein